MGFPNLDRIYTTASSEYEQISQLVSNSDPEIQYKMGLCSYYGFIAKKDRQAASLWFQQAEMSGHLDAKYYYALMLDQEEESFLKFKEAAKKGHNKAMYKLAEMFEQGKGCAEPSLPKAIKWYRKAADSGMVVAESALTRLTAASPASNRTNKEEKWLHDLILKASDGDENAQIQLIEFYLQSHSESHQQHAFLWSEKLCKEKKHPQGLLYLGFCYENGIGCSVNVDEAATIYKKAISKDSIAAEARFRLGHLYIKGGGKQVVINISSAISNYFEAAKKGHMKAKQELERLKAEGSSEATEKLTILCQLGR